jgi:hypothetical protein
MNFWSVLPQIWLPCRLSPFPPHRTIRDWSDASRHFLSWFVWPSHPLCGSSIYSIRFQPLKAVQSADFLSPFWSSTLNCSQPEAPFDRPHSISEGLKSFLIVFPRTLSPFWSSNFGTCPLLMGLLVWWRERSCFRPFIHSIPDWTRNDSHSTVTWFGT